MPDDRIERRERACTVLCLLVRVNLPVPPGAYECISTDVDTISRAQNLYRACKYAASRPRNNKSPSNVILEQNFGMSRKRPDKNVPLQRR
jgi:hypothetical protein